MKTRKDFFEIYRTIGEQGYLHDFRMRRLRNEQTCKKKVRKAQVFKSRSTDEFAYRWLLFLLGVKSQQYPIAYPRLIDSKASGTSAPNTTRRVLLEA